MLLFFLFIKCVIIKMSEEEKRTRMEAAMRKIEDFYFGDEEDAGEKIFNQFAQTHAHHFHSAVDAEGEENKLEYTVAYNEFQHLFEHKLEEMISSEGLSI